ncbi:DUF4292 domain-containing protein [Arenibacter sp. GZD96]|uniref:DUF4292 domain-containing protein n=1 Tax=Aurantibrevibacter litoralis TaxID=3106030 RepID=UPI002AFF36EC|nr:DUF4292 domain-containing protein [Arenibacter sp. GZD-96]MEA1786655.1 DUF4292 domain-containing protein [Arenibacter sp. GZD-96]
MMQAARFWNRSWIFLVFAFFALSACTSNKVMRDGTINERLSTKAIVRNHYANELNFKTLSGRMKIDYSDGASSQGVSVSLRIEKDKAIWISAPLGMVKAYITPDRVSFYNKLENEYFDGDFSYLSAMLGTELDFQKVQNVLLGQALFDLREDKFAVEISEGNYQLKPININQLFKALYQIEPTHFKMASLVLAQPLKNRMLEIQYKDYQKINQRIAPSDIKINALNGSTQSTIELTYRNLEFNKPLSFPYSIPKGFKEISLN